jgi:hypothetical protein
MPIGIARHFVFSQEQTVALAAARPIELVRTG